MASSWSIMIIEKEDGTIAFKPDVPGGQPGQALGVKKGDNVTWNNMTDRDLQLVASTSAPPPFLADPIPKGQVSDLIFNVTQAAGTIINYACVQPSVPTHSIVVVP